ncbi:MAG TPA: hypothetical protein VFE25_02395, partial [Opitutaceae bacterium]|nr:hypothetical protein [Opitutaceae bacterium]
SAPPEYLHNRIGAVFIPRNEQSDDLIAVVANGSPASIAGVLDGDVLIQIDDLKVSKWRTIPGILPLSRFWEMPAGTAHSIVLRRGQSLITLNVVLKNILTEMPSKAAK